MVKDEFRDASDVERIVILLGRINEQLDRIAYALENRS